MPKDFFEKPFDEGTLTKLHLFEEYLKEWLPVFVKSASYPNALKTINLFDFFAGAGYDSNNVKGSPLRVIESIFHHFPDIIQSNIKVNVYLNEFDKTNFDRLKTKIDSLNLDKKPFNINLECKDFKEVFKVWLPKMTNAANLVWLDQFGVKFITPEVFLSLTSVPKTDILFFVASSYFKRFTEQDGIYDILKISKEEIQNFKAQHVHRFVADKYRDIVHLKNPKYYLSSYSIKKNANYYGLIFGSAHPLGMEKFLNVCWRQNETTGEANFDIDDDRINLTAPSLFEEYNKSQKLNVFEFELEKKILDRSLKSEAEIYFFALNSGFLGKHVRVVIDKLIKQKKINKESYAFTFDTLSQKDRVVKQIKIL